MPLEQVGKHGITIAFDADGKHFSGTYLPQIAVEEGEKRGACAVVGAVATTTVGRWQTSRPRCDGDCRGWTGAGWSVQQAIDSLVRKAGFRGEVTAATRRALTVTRYQSTTFTLTFEEYRHARRSMDDRIARQQIIGNSPPKLSTDGATSTRRKFGLCGW
eukprot:COSAG01_NODE_4091_length_5357_cov_9.914036_4_plen_160_part_00